MSRPFGSTVRAVGASVVTLSLVECTLLMGDLPDPIESQMSDGGSSAGEGAAAHAGTRMEATGGAGAQAGALGSSGGRAAASSGGANGEDDDAGTSSGSGNGGEPGTSGGASSGGAPNGGASGGTRSGGAPSGGAMTGGTDTGGAPSGGAMTGGTSSGGAMTGGTSSGGTMTGGTSSGGAMAGGTGASGGAANGGSTSGAAGTGGVLDCDRDRDGHRARINGCNGLDCDDDDSDAHPGQVGFFEDERVSGGFDYDCNGRNDPQFQAPLDCALLLSNCSGEGFSGSVPACGASGTWIRCAETLPPLPVVCSSQSAGTRRMACR